MATTGELANSVVNKFTLMWEQAEIEFKDQTGLSLRQTGKNERPDNIAERFVRKLTNADADDNKNTRRKQKAAKVIKFVLSFIETMSGIASSAASMVFGGPADMCFNAFKFIIDIPTKIGKVYDDLIQLFSEMSTTLLEFQVLEKISGKMTIDEELLTTTHAILVAFVSICTKYIKFLKGGKRHYVAVAFRSVFLSDDCGVLDELRMFQTLAKQQSSMIGTASYKHILNIEDAITEYSDNFQELQEGQKQILGGVETLVASDSDRKTALLIRASLNLIEDRLRIKGSTANMPLLDLAQVQAKINEEACQWLFDVDEYRKWVQADSKDQLLCIAGEKQSGKRYLLASMARKLKQIDPTSVILYYTFPKNDGKKASSAEETSSWVLKILALQNAQQNPRYAADLEASLGQTNLLDGINIFELWRLLKFDDFLKPSEKETFILLNGLQDGDIGLLNLFLKSGRGKSKLPKIAATGVPRTFTVLSDSVSILHTIDHNTAGLVQYIKREMSAIEILRDEHDNIQRLRAALLDQLPPRCGGNFSIISQKLVQVKDAIDANKTHDEVLAVLDADSSIDVDRRKQMARQLEALEKDLSPIDIEDLNTMLVWIMYGKMWLDVDRLEAILQKNKRNNPVLPLRVRLRRFSAIIYVDFIDCVWPVEGWFEFLKSRSEQQLQREVTAGGEPKISLRIDIDRADRTVVKKFLWDLTASFTFDHPISSDIDPGQARPKIKLVADAEAHLGIIYDCIRHCTQDFEPRSSVWSSYALIKLPAHLEAVRELGLSIIQKRSVCRKLISFFSDASILEDQWEILEYNEDDWVSMETCLAVEQLFEEAGREDGFEAIERKWIADNVKSESDRGAFLRPLTLVVAKKWFVTRHFDAEHACRWINAFIEIQSSQIPFGALHNEGSSVGAQSPSQEVSQHTPQLTSDDIILRAAKWCAKHLDIAETSAAYLQGLGLAFGGDHQLEKAMSLLESAIQSSDSDWQLNAKLADAYVDMSKWDDARGQYLTAIRKADFDQSNEVHRLRYQRLLCRLARSERKSGDNEAAVRHYEEILKLDSTSNDEFWQCFKLLCKLDRTEDMESMLSSERLDQYDRSVSLPERLKLVFGPRFIGQKTAYWIARAFQHEPIATHLGRAFGLLMDEEGLLPVARAEYMMCIGTICVTSESQDVVETGARYLNQCMKLITAIERSSGDDRDNWARTWIRQSLQEVISQLSCRRSQVIGAAGTAHPLWDAFVSSIQDSLPPFIPRYSTAMTHLSYQYVLQKEYDKARELMKVDVEKALQIGWYTSNLEERYRCLAEAFKHTGDDLNALTAWSLMRPSDITDGQGGAARNESHNNVGRPERLSAPARRRKSEPRHGNAWIVCSGCIDMTWRFADDFHTCKQCPKVVVCLPCLGKIRAGTLERILCDASHDFLWVPPWSDEEYWKVGKDNVLVGGELDAEGRRVGGTVQSEDEWLQHVCEIWGVELEVEGESESKSDNVVSASESGDDLNDSNND